MSTPPDPKSTRRSNSKLALRSRRRMKKKSKRRNWMTLFIRTLDTASMTAAATLPPPTLQVPPAVARRPMDKRSSLRRPTQPLRRMLPLPKRFKNRAPSHTPAARPTTPIRGPSALSNGPDRTLRSRGARITVRGISTWAWNLDLSKLLTRTIISILLSNCGEKGKIRGLWILD